jgi:hypothetical protein
MEPKPRNAFRAARAGSAQAARPSARNARRANRKGRQVSVRALTAFLGPMLRKPAPHRAPCAALGKSRPAHHRRAARSVRRASSRGERARARALTAFLDPMLRKPAPHRAPCAALGKSRPAHHRRAARSVRRASRKERRGSPSASRAMPEQSLRMLPRPSAMTALAITTRPSARRPVLSAPRTSTTPSTESA